MCASYPNYKPIDISETIDIWASMLSDYSYDNIALALKSYITTDTSGFAPSIGQLIDKLSTFSEPQNMTELEAWSLVMNALSKSAYDSVESFSKLPITIQKAVGSPNQLKIWATDIDFNEQVASSNFFRSYRTEVKREEEFRKLPKEARNLILSNEDTLLISENQRMIESSKKRTEEDSIYSICKNAVPMPDKYLKILEGGLEND